MYGVKQHNWGRDVPAGGNPAKGKNNPRGLPRDGEEDNMDSNPRTQRAEQSSYDGKEIVRRLVVGSEAIDRMRKEIDSVVNMVVGMVSNTDIINWKFDFDKVPVAGFYEQIFETQKCRWIILEGSVGKLWVRCLLIDHTGQSYSEEQAYYSFAGSQQIELRHVQKVHEALPVFVDGMAKAFPSLNTRWQLFLNAADYFEHRR